MGGKRWLAVVSDSPASRRAAVVLEAEREAIRSADLELARALTGTDVTIWRKQPDGRWRAVLDAGTTGVPKPSASAADRSGSPRP